MTRCSAEGIATLEAAKARAEEAGWGFAVVADPKGPCVEALSNDHSTTIVETYADRHAARAALAS